MLLLIINWFTYFVGFFLVIRRVGLCVDGSRVYGKHAELLREGGAILYLQATPRTRTNKAPQLVVDSLIMSINESD
mgnify:CR=1 FL=1